MNKCGCGIVVETGSFCLLSDLRHDGTCGFFACYKVRSFFRSCLTWAMVSYAPEMEENSKTK